MMTPGSAARVAQRYAEIVVCGGGCYGGYYVRQLLRARAAGALDVGTITVVDQDPDAPVLRLITAIERDDQDGVHRHAWRMRARDASAPAGEDAIGLYHNAPLKAACEPWADFFRRWFSVSDEEAGERRAVVPSPLMPNLLADWVGERIRAHRPAVQLARVPLSVTPYTPWQRASADPSHYASFATWMCPINCIEPPRCPETRGPRDWSMPVTVAATAAAAAAAGQGYDVVAVFHTTHRLYGVGMFDRQDAGAADRRIADAPQERPLRVLVASASHCHAAFAEFVTDR
jgi:hypothetical protein